jgi:hypothetical protein
MKGYNILSLEKHHLEEIAHSTKKYMYSNAHTLLVGIRNQRL